MRLGWLLTDPGHDVLSDGWKRPFYRPRHGKPPVLLRTAGSVVAVVSPVLERLLGTGDEDPAPGAARPAS